MKNRERVILPDYLKNDLQTACDDYMSELLDLYQCQNWGMGFVDFLAQVTEITLETIGKWQNENVDGEE
jgi:hypothetical protein